MSTLPNVNITDVIVELMLLLVFQVSTPGGSQIYYRYLGSTMDEREIPVTPNSEIPAATDLECSYYGCYIADNRKYIFPYVLTLEEIKCTFTKEG